MTQSVMGQSARGATYPAGPIVLALGCVNAQRYMTGANQPLKRWKPDLVRVEIPEHHLDSLRQYVSPTNDAEALVKLADEHGDNAISWPELKALFQSTGWRVEQTFRLIHKAIVVRLETDFDALKVELVFVSAKVVSKNPLLPVAMKRYFAEAWFFEIPADEHGLPKRIWTEPICETCDTLMRAAGSAFMCAGCGSVHGSSDQGERLPCPDCPNQMKEMILDGRPGRVFWCEHCGHEEVVTPSCKHPEGDYPTAHEGGNIWRCTKQWCDKTYDETGRQLDGE